MLPEIYKINRIMLSYIKIFQLQTIMYQLTQNLTDFLAVVALISIKS